MPCGNLNLKASKSKFEKLLDRVLTRDITVEDLMAFNEWAQQEWDFPTGDWCEDFGTFKTVGTGFELDSFLTDQMPCWGDDVTECSDEEFDVLAGLLPDF